MTEKWRDGKGRKGKENRGYKSKNEEESWGGMI